MKAFLLLLSFIIVSTLNAQVFKSIEFETEFSTKFSIGRQMRETIEFDPTTQINYPSTDRFQNPAYSLELSSLVSLSKTFRAGISSGIVVVWDENDPLVANQYFHRVMIPLVIRFQFSFPLAQEIELSPEGKIGYQFMRSNFGATDEGFLFTQTGGLATGVKFRIGKNFGKYYPSISVGYELNRIHNDMSLGWLEGYDYNEKIDFSTNYHLINVGIGIRM